RRRVLTAYRDPGPWGGAADGMWGCGDHIRRVVFDDRFFKQGTSSVGQQPSGNKPPPGQAFAHQLKGMDLLADGVQKMDRLQELAMDFDFPLIAALLIWTDRNYRKVLEMQRAAADAAKNASTATGTGAAGEAATATSDSGGQGQSSVESSNAAVEKPMGTIMVFLPSWLDAEKCAAVLRSDLPLDHRDGGRGTANSERTGSITNAITSSSTAETRFRIHQLTEYSSAVEIEAIRA
ncbi:unnamed protein product, partial [Amoebophrya sp. A25]